MAKIDDTTISARTGREAGPSRRQILQGGAGLGALAFGGVLPQAARAAAGPENTIKVGFVSPRTGPLGGFGECDPWVLDQFRAKLKAGLQVGGKTYDVILLDRDSQSDPARAGQLAKGLITSDHVDLMLTTSTPEVTNPVADAAEAAGTPCLSTIVPWESWYFGRGAKPGQPSPFKWTYHFSFGGKDFFVAYNSLWNGPVKTNKKVGILYPNDADGNAVRENLAPALAKAGFDIVDGGAYEDGTTDFSAQISKFKAANCEIFNTFPIPPDFATFWRQAAQQGYTRMVKIAQIAKTGLFPSQVEALGTLGYTLATGCYWHPTFPYGSPVLGWSSQQISDAYEKGTGRQWNQQVGASVALLDGGITTLEKSTNPKDKNAVVAALKALKVTTPMGPIDFSTGPVPNVSTTPIIGCQWLKAKPGSKFKLQLVINENADDKKVPIEAPLVPYHP